MKKKLYFISKACKKDNKLRTKVKSKIIDYHKGQYKN